MNQKLIIIHLIMQNQGFIYLNRPVQCQRRSVQTDIRQRPDARYDKPLALAWRHWFEPKLAALPRHEAGDLERPVKRNKNNNESHWTEFSATYISILNVLFLLIVYDIMSRYLTKAKRKLRHRPWTRASARLHDNKLSSQATENTTFAQ